MSGASEMILASQSAFRLFWREWMLAELMRCGANERVATLLLDKPIPWMLPLPSE